jgi:alpha-L-fucosidase
VTTAEVWDLLAETAGKGYNLLLNTPPLPDGSLDPEDTAVLREVGERIEREGIPRDGDGDGDGGGRSAV